MTSQEHDLHLAWEELADRESEHDQPGAQRAWAMIQKLQQRRGDHDDDTT